jgi:hypothetical protein
VPQGDAANSEGSSSGIGGGCFFCVLVNPQEVELSNDAKIGQSFDILRRG